MYNSKGWKRGFSWLNLKQKVIGSETPKIELNRNERQRLGFRKLEHKKVNTIRQWSCAPLIPALGRQ